MPAMPVTTTIVHTTSTFSLPVKPGFLVASLRKKHALIRAVRPAGVISSEWTETQRESELTDECPTPNRDCLWTAAC